MGLFALVPGWLWACLLAVLSAVSCTQAVRLEHARVEVAQLRQAAAMAEARAAELSRSMLVKVAEAQNEAKKREAALRAAADGARAESDGLRDDIDDIRGQLAGVTGAAAVERAATVGAVLKQCAARHQELAQRCDGHVSDIRTLMDAWPTAGPDGSDVK